MEIINPLATSNRRLIVDMILLVIVALAIFDAQIITKTAAQEDNGNTEAKATVRMIILPVDTSRVQTSH